MTAPRTSEHLRAASPAGPTVTGYERVQLVHGLVQWVAEREGLRVLHIKGPVVAAQFPGPDRTSVDVDVLAPPLGAKQLSACLTRLGWRLVYEHDEFALGQHAAVLDHTVWGVTLELHYYFPGFYRPAAEVFDALWRRRSVVEIAGRPCPAPDRIAHGLILLMHAARTPTIRTRGDVARVLGSYSGEDRAALIRLACELGAVAALDAVLPTGALSHGEKAQARYWRLCVRGAPAAALWLGAIGAERTWHGRWQVLRHAVAPHLPAGQLQWSNGADFSRHLMGHWHRGAQQVPHLLRLRVDLKRSRQGRR